jgi:hypothetical protein
VIYRDKWRGIVRQAKAHSGLQPTEEEDNLRAGRMPVRAGHSVSEKNSLDADRICALSTRHTVCLSVYVKVKVK